MRQVDTRIQDMDPEGRSSLLDADDLPELVPGELLELLHLALSEPTIDAMEKGTAPPPQASA
jgi:hypothetical protein